ncbi:hypothetical protein EVAR_38338_1 [Eumeta japonica]|uniref:Uncharacterized protein n=1 Tax=Eumeta variegata TaxID=151549 RepID=A0A4C1X551_EUMVA|nr:hypothetical protein EVAR_38338_1 [Eumeta japonica]
MANQHKNRYRVALSQHVWHRVEAAGDRLMTAYSTIEFVLKPHYFVRGKIKVPALELLTALPSDDALKPRIGLQPKSKLRPWLGKQTSCAVIRCTAYIYSVYSQSVELSAEEERVRPSPPVQTKQREAVVFPVHRPPEPGDAAPGLMSDVALTTFSLATSLCLPTVLR